MNPTEEEAEEAYDYYKGKYNAAANQKRTSERQEQTYREQKNSAVSQKNELTEQKLSFEDRLEGIVKIIAMLDGTGGWFATNVPDSIGKAQRALTKTDSSFRGCIRLTGGGSASLESAFTMKTVDADMNSASALQAYKTEKTRLEGQIEELGKQINSLAEQISSLNGKISACNSEQWSLQSSMNSYAYDMNHYKKYIG